MTVRPTPESYIPEFVEILSIKDETSESAALDKLISIGGTITAYATPNVSVGFARVNPYFHHDLRKLFSYWRSTVRNVLRKNKKLFKDEYEIFEESDGVSSSPLVQEDPDFNTPYAATLIKNIQFESSRRLETLRIARKKAENAETERRIQNQPASFNVQTSTLFLKGSPIVISKNMKKVP